jgi:hypothetical protein
MSENLDLVTLSGMAEGWRNWLDSWENRHGAVTRLATYFDCNRAFADLGLAE